MTNTDIGDSAMPVSAPLRQLMPPTCANAATQAVLTTKRASSSINANPAPAITRSQVSVDTANTNSSTVSSSPMPPKLRSVRLKATRRWRAIRPKVSVASTGDNSVAWAIATSSSTPSAKATVPSRARLPSWRSTKGTATPKTAPSTADASSSNRLCVAACGRLPEVRKIHTPTMTLNTKTASTQLMATRCSTRSVTWPELSSSLITRSTPAGEVDMASDASNSDVIDGNPVAWAIAYTTAKVTADSTRPVTAIHGLMRSQCRLMR